MKRELEDELERKLFLEELLEKAEVTDDERMVLYSLSIGSSLVELAKSLNVPEHRLYMMKEKLIKRLQKTVEEMGEELPDFSNFDIDIEAMQLRDKGHNFQSIADIQGTSVARAQERAKKGREKTNTPMPERKYYHTVKRAKRVFAPRHCAICDKTVYYKQCLCIDCSKKYGTEEPWVKELIRISTRDYETLQLGREYTFSDSSRDTNGEYVFVERDH